MSPGPPRVFLLPGIFGDELPFAEFRAALSGRVAFELLDYPDIDRPTREIRDFDRILGETVQRIGLLQPSGEVHIAGYSFGGLVGFAAACRLRAEGRSVGLLALLDSRAPSLKIPGFIRRLRNRDEAIGPAAAAADAASRLLIAAGLAEAVRAAIGPAGKLLGAKPAHGLRRLLLQNLRGRALRDLRPDRVDGPLVLFRAQEQPVPDLPLDLGWGAHCASVSTAPLRGDHTSWLRGDNLAVNAELIWSEMASRIRR